MNDPVKIVAAEFAKRTEYTVDDLIHRTGFKGETVLHALNRLKQYGLVQVEERKDRRDPAIWKKKVKP